MRLENRCALKVKRTFCLKVGCAAICAKMQCVYCIKSSGEVLSRKKSDHVVLVRDKWSPLLPYHDIQWICETHCEPSLKKLKDPGLKKYGCVTLLPKESVFSSKFISFFSESPQYAKSSFCVSSKSNFNRFSFSRNLVCRAQSILVLMWRLCTVKILKFQLCLLMTFLRNFNHLQLMGVGMLQLSLFSIDLL